MRKGFNRQLVAVLTIAWIDGVLTLRRAPLWVVSYLLMPLALLFFFSIYGNPVMMRLSIIGGIVMIAVSNGISILGDAAFYRIYVKYQDLLIATPLRPISYILGLSLSMLIFASPGLTLFLALAWLIGIITMPFALVLAVCLIMVWASSSFMGFAISTLFNRLRHVWPIASILSLLLGILPPVYYPATILPQGYRWIGALAPTGAATMILHQVAGFVELEASAIITSIVSLIGYMTMFMLLSILKVKWREK